MNDTLSTVPTRITVDATPDGHILVISVDDDLVSNVLRLTTAGAYKLALRLINTAESIQLPNEH
jgi:hypothetical protein